MKPDILSTLPFSEIFGLAIIALSDRCVKALERISLMRENDPAYVTTLKAMYTPLFFKMRKLLELYRLDTGTDYELEALCGLRPSDLDLTKGE